MRNNSRSPSPPPTADFATPSDHTEHLLLDPNAGGLYTEHPLQSPAASSQYSVRSWYSTTTLQSLRLELTNLGSKLQQSGRQFDGFEEPSYPRITTLTVLCLVTYPAFYILTLVAKDRSLFIVRAIVGVWCWVAGFILGYFLFEIGAQHLEAASKSALVWYRSFLRLYFKQPGPR